MDFLRKIKENPMRALKIAALVLAAVVVLGAVSALRPGMMNSGWGRAYDSVAQAPVFNGMMYQEKAVGMGGGALSYRNVAPVYNGGTSGNDAEKYEVTDYSASIETNDLDGTCGTILSWKSKDYVVFENSNSTDRSCAHTFKVKKANVPEILSALKGLDPRDLSENTYTIKNQVTDYTSQEDILKKKLASLDDTLKGALKAYDEITSIATRANDAGSLAKIIDSKLQMIERLTAEKLDASTQLDYLARSKADSLDKLDYTRFYVSVYENKYVDGKSIKDSWKQAVRDFVYNANGTIQGITIGIIALVLGIIQWAIYIMILLLVVKYGWRFVKSFWKR